GVRSDVVGTPATVWYGPRLGLKAGGLPPRHPHRRHLDRAFCCRTATCTDAWKHELGAGHLDAHSPTLQVIYRRDCRVVGRLEPQGRVGDPEFLAEFPLDRDDRGPEPRPRGGP